MTGAVCTQLGPEITGAPKVATVGAEGCERVRGASSRRVWLQEVARSQTLFKTSRGYQCHRRCSESRWI